MTEIRLDYQPTAKQAVLHSTTARQVFFGGAAGPGKSHGLRWDAIVNCLRNPGLDAFLFRRTLHELEDNHIRKIQAEIPPQLGQYNTTKKRMDFHNGSGINFCYCENEQDVTRYQGAEMHWLGVDEAAHLTEYQINYLRTRVRLGSWKPAEGHLPRVVFASNPGGPGHNFLKERFVTAGPAMTLFWDETMMDPRTEGHKGWLSIYIPGLMSDNPYLDEGYAGQFSGLPEELAKALREGDWDAIVGKALESLSREKHMLPAFKVPAHAMKFMAMDWGTAAPFSVGWYCVSDGWEIVRKDATVYVPPGALVRYDEWYGWSGKANKGCRMESPVVAKEILRKEDERKETMDYRVGDYEMWARSDGPSVEERMRSTTDGRFVMRQSKKDRKANYTEFLARLKGEEFEMGGKIQYLPMFYATESCRHFWRTAPTLTLDPTDPEKGPETKNQEDHVYDEVCYALRSRPYMITEEDRYRVEYRNARKMAGSGADPYAT